MPPNKQVAIEVADRLAKVKRQVEELLAPRLTCRVNRFAPGGSPGHRCLQQVQAFYRIEGDDLFFPAGIVPESCSRYSRPATRLPPAIAASLMSKWRG